MASKIWEQIVFEPCRGIYIILTDFLSFTSFSIVFKLLILSSLSFISLDIRIKFVGHNIFQLVIAVILITGLIDTTPAL